MNHAIKRIFIVDDHQFVIDSVRLLLGDLPQFEITGSTTQPLLAAGLLEHAKTDVLITDISMPGMNGIELTRLIKSKFPEIKIIALSMSSDSQVVAEMIAAGVSGYILKNSAGKEMAEALEKVAAGIPYFSPEIQALLMSSFKRNTRSA